MNKYSHTAETRKKISEALKGRHLSEECKIKLSEINKGKHHSEETKRMMSKKFSGKNNTFYGKKHSIKTKNILRIARIGKSASDETKLKISKNMKGKYRSEEHRKHLSEANKGRIHSEETKRKIRNSMINKFNKENNPNWRGGITPKHLIIRSSKEYKLWRNAVLIRDNYTCIWCGYKGNKLQVDHIKPFALYPELRFAIDNGRTLCVYCHRTTNTYAGKGSRNAAR